MDVTLESSVSLCASPLPPSCGMATYPYFLSHHLCFPSGKFEVGRLQVLGWMVMDLSVLKSSTSVCPGNEAHWEGTLEADPRAAGPEGGTRLGWGSFSGICGDTISEMWFLQGYKV